MAKIALLTNFMEFVEGYSLTGIVKDQAKMLTRHGHDVHLFVNEKYHGETFSEDVTLRKLIPFTHLTDYHKEADLSDTHKGVVQKTVEVFQEFLADCDFVFTHDFVFTGWNLPYGLAIQAMANDPLLAKARWLHWVHSVPSVSYDWWNVRKYGPKHKIVYPNSTEQLRAAEQFRGAISDVRVIHHIKDIRTWFDYCQDSWDFIDDFPGVLNAEVVQVYPASTDRLEAKRVDLVIKVFAELKRKGIKVCLVIANQWATGTQPKQNVNRYYQIASRNGLERDVEFIMTSEWKEKFRNGLPKRFLRELMLCSNLFIFPTREESFGLVGPEAALSGAILPVLNKSLNMMFEVNGLNGLYFDFGSHHNSFAPPNEAEYYNGVATIILGRMRENETLMHRTFMRRSYNMDHLYIREYEPIMKESQVW